jgi:hypothetical protein
LPLFAISTRLGRGLEADPVLLLQRLELARDFGNAE